MHVIAVRAQTHKRTLCQHR